MRTRVAFGQLLALSAATLFIIELGEFLMLAYVWLFTSAAKQVGFSDSLAVIAVTFLVASGAALGCLASLRSVALRRAWPSSKRFVGIGFIIAATQTALLMFSLFSPSSLWLAEFFTSKMPSFLSGTLAALALILVGLVVRPWKME